MLSRYRLLISMRPIPKDGFTDKSPLANPSCWSMYLSRLIAKIVLSKLGLSTPVPVFDLPQALLVFEKLASKVGVFFGKKPLRSHMYAEKRALHKLKNSPIALHFST